MRRPVLTYFDVCKAPSGAWVGRCPSPQLPRSLSDIFISFIAASIKHWLVTIWSGVLTFTYRSAGCLQLVNYNQIRSTQLMLQNSWPSRHRLQSRPLFIQSLKRLRAFTKRVVFTLNTNLSPLLCFILITKYILISVCFYFYNFFKNSKYKQFYT